MAFIEVETRESVSERQGPHFGFFSFSSASTVIYVNLCNPTGSSKSGASIKEGFPQCVELFRTAKEAPPRCLPRERSGRGERGGRGLQQFRVRQFCRGKDGEGETKEKDGELLRGRRDTFNFPLAVFGPCRDIST